MEGTLAEEYKGKFPEIERKSSGKWRKQHDEMIAAMKEAKKAPRPKTAGGTEIPVDIRMWNKSSGYLENAIFFFPKCELVSLVYSTSFKLSIQAKVMLTYMINLAPEINWG